MELKEYQKKTLDQVKRYLKIPTGGGKTILACHIIDLINRTYLKKQTGIVLWIVPTTQIYRQTLTSLKNREHPYRQVLDIASGGRLYQKKWTDSPDQMWKRGSVIYPGDESYPLGKDVVTLPVKELSKIMEPA